MPGNIHGKIWTSSKAAFGLRKSVPGSCVEGDV